MNTPTLPRIAVRFATREDVPVIVSLIREGAEHEGHAHLAPATPQRMEAERVGPGSACESLIGEQAGETVGCAIFFHNFSTFLCRKGLYLEDLFVRPTARGTGMGKLLLQRLAQLAVERGCGRFGGSGLGRDVGPPGVFPP